jgi:tubulin-specific chaperone A
LIKEVAYYEKEVQENEGKLQQMKDQNKDPYDIKKFIEILGESQMMVPDSQARLRQMLEELAVAVENAASADVASNSEWFLTAQQLLKVYNVSLTDDLQETTVEDGDDVF